MTMDELTKRFAYHPPRDEETKMKHEEIRFLHLQLARRIMEIVPVGREQSLVITKLEESMMWANAGIARNQ